MMKKFASPILTGVIVTAVIVTVVCLFRGETLLMWGTCMVCSMITYAILNRIEVS